VTVYNDSFKMKLVQKMLLPNARPVSALAQETGLPEGTLYRWRKETTLGGMSTYRSDDEAPPTHPPHQWSAAEKVAAVLDAAGVAEAELGAFLRRKGLHAAQLTEWRKQVTDGAVAALEGGGVTKAARKTASAAARRLRELERELRRKDKALAEAAALLILQKKVRAIWGAEDDDTDPKSEE
jgi:transposase-like protein